jgi:DNA-binding transcriptional regulator GbsR (MarR family)
MAASRLSHSAKGRSRPAAPHNFVERFALVLESDGFPRIAGRIFGYLILSDDEVSLDDLAAVLGASKASASVNTRMLEDKGLIERVSKPGDRRDYYRIAADPFLHTMEQRIAKWNRVRSVIGEALDDMSIAPNARGRLRDFDNATGQMAEILGAALHKLRTRKK